METTPLLSTSDSDEIDLIALTKTLWTGRTIILKSILVCGIIGILIAITTPKEYEASSIMVPTGGGGNSNIGGLGGLAALAGINFNSQSGSELSTTVYPQIITSLPYQLELMKTLLNFSGLNEPVSFYEYFAEIQKPNPLFKYTIGLPGVIIGLPGTIIAAIRGEEKKSTVTVENNRPIALTGKQQSVRQILSQSISLTVNIKGGTLTLTSKMSEPLVAAQLGQRAQELLQQYIIAFKINKAKTNLEFIQQRFDETAQKFEAIQTRLANFSDRNKNVSLATAKSEEVKLTSQYNLIFSIYSELAKQLEQAKIQVKQDTPAFSIIEPISIPTNKSKPERSKILFIWLLVGGILGIGLIFVKNFIEAMKIKWKVKEDSQV